MRRSRKVVAGALACLPAGVFRVNQSRSLSGASLGAGGPATDRRLGLPRVAKSVGVGTGSWSTDVHESDARRATFVGSSRFSPLAVPSCWRPLSSQRLWETR